jgi:hypothetical protein
MQSSRAWGRSPAPDLRQRAASRWLTQPALSKVLIEVHPLMQDAYDIDASFDSAIEHEMRAGRILAVACADVIATAATTGILGHDLYGTLNLGT